MKALLQDAWRGLRSRAGVSAVSTAVLALAMAACLLVAWLAHALAVGDPTLPVSDRIVMLDFKGNPPGQESPWFTGSPVSFGPMLKARGVPLDLIARTMERSLPLRVEGELRDVPLLMADPELVPLFGMQALAGDLPATLRMHDGVAVTLPLVHRLWGELPASAVLGRSLTADGKVYIVTAVLPAPDPRNPAAQYVPYELMAGYDSAANDDDEAARAAIYMINGRVFARLRDGTGVAQVGGWMREAFRASAGYQKLPAEWKTGREAAYFRGLTLDRLPFEGAANALRWQQIGALGAACGLLLVLAAVNAMNLQAAQLLQRQRETALRRSLGADSGHLLKLWAAETLLMLLLAGTAAVLLAWWCAPLLGHWMGLDEGLGLGGFLPPVLWLGLALVLCVLLPVIVLTPAVLALRRAPAPALQGRTASEGPLGRRVRQGLLALQLGGALLLLVLTGVMAAQYDHLLHADRGFATTNRLVMTVQARPEDAPKAAPFMAALLRSPAVEHWAFSDVVPARERPAQTVTQVGPDGLRQVMNLTRVTPDYFATYGMKILAGDPHRGEGEVRLVLDLDAAHALGFAQAADAVGAVVLGGCSYLQPGREPQRVVAVVAPARLQPAREAALPQGFIVSDDPQGNLTVYGRDPVALRAALDKAWKAVGAPLVRFVETADEERAAAYRQEARLTGLLAAVALLTVGVAMVGAYALLDDTLRRRRTEIVLRRLHGADHGAIAAQLAREFGVPLALVALVAAPLAGWFGFRYLSSFVDRVATGPGLALPLVAGLVLTVLVTLLASLRHLRQALALQPIEALA